MTRYLAFALIVSGLLLSGYTVVQVFEYFMPPKNETVILIGEAPDGSTVFQGVFPSQSHYTAYQELVEMEKKYSHTPKDVVFFEKLKSLTQDRKIDPDSLHDAIRQMKAMKGEK